jgi:hypothetical protein
MDGKGQRQRNDTDKTRSIGKKNKTNSDDAVDSISATTDNADTCAKNAVRLTSEKRWVDADGTKVVADDTINAKTNNADTHTNNAIRPTSGTQIVDADGTKVVTDNTINATTNNVDTHTNNSFKTAKTDFDALSTMNTGTSDVVIKRTNYAYVTKETDIEQQLCAENLAVGHGSEDQDASLAKANEGEQYFQLIHIYYVQLL